MVDRNLKVAAPVDLEDDDPFAELTRIMGFDPRQPARPAAVAPLAPVRQPEPEVAEDDFSIDLEKELMGEFGSDEELQASADWSEPAVMPQARIAVEPEVPVAVEQAAQEPEFEPFELDLSDELSDATAVEVEEAVQAAVKDVAVSPQPEAADDLELIDADAFAFDLEADEADAPVAVEPAVEAALPPVAVAAEAVEEEDFDTAFDAALADIDMDFAAGEQAAGEPAAAWEPVEDEEPADELAAGDLAAEEPAVFEAAAAQDDFELDIGELEFEEPQAEFMAASPLPEAEAYDEEEPAFEAVAEDDLMAELDQVLAGQPEAVDLESEPEPQTTWTQAPAEQARWVEVPAEAEPSLEDELNALLGNKPVATVPVAEQAAAPAWAPEAADPAFEDELVWDLDEAAPAEAVADVPDVDHDDFETALARGLESGETGGETWRAAASQVRHADPLAEIEALTAKYSAPEPAAPALPVADDFDFPSDVFDEAPDVETVDVSDQAVALADDLDLPEVGYDEELPPVSAYDDIDAEFAGLLNDMNAVEPQPARHAAPTAEAYEDDFRVAPYQTAAYAVAAGAAAAAARPAQARHEEFFDETAFDANDLPGSRPLQGAPQSLDGYDFDADFDDGAVAQQRDERPAPQRRGLMIGAVVGGMALLGALGAFALSFGGDGSTDAPAIVRADDQPIKVKPTNPGGTTVPNQESKVYDSVAGTSAATDPQQERLVTTAEEPVEMVMPPADEDVDIGDLAAGEAEAPAAKSEDRIEQILDEDQGAASEVAAVAPRKVRTMIVKPDGTLVPREDPAPVAVETPAQPEATASVPATTAGVPEMDATAPQEPALKPAAVETASTTPDAAPIAPQRPAEQPIDVVGEVKPDRVAAVSAPAAGAWAMQIASQPSEAAAQSSYQDLARRYGSVLNGQPVNIVKAEIAGKGTFWRVRVPAGSRNEAVSLCERYKSAGGNCFVSK